MKRHLCGTHAVLEAIESNRGAVAVVYVADPKASARVVELARNRGVAVETRDAATLDALAGGVRHQGVMAISAEGYPYLDLDTLLRKTPSDTGLLVALDEITDPHNFGAIVRSAVALGAHGVITLRDRAAEVNAAAVRTSAGATERCDIARVTNLAQTLRGLTHDGWTAVGLAAEGEVTLDAVDLRGPTVLVVGSEASGLRRLVRERCTVLARIPLAGTIASLNASVAAGVALYEAVRQRGAAVTA